MPAIKGSLHFSESGLAWMVDAYMVPFGGFLLLGGRAGDLVGRRRVLLAGTCVFTVASLGSALAPSAGVMIATRALEGLSAGFVVPMTFAMLGSVFPAGAARNRAFGAWGGVTASAATLGLVLGGVLVSAIGWRWIFLVNLPVGAVVIAAALGVLPADGPRRRRRRHPRDGHRAHHRGRADLRVPRRVRGQRRADRGRPAGSGRSAARGRPGRTDQHDRAASGLAARLHLRLAYRSVASRIPVHTMGGRGLHRAWEGAAAHGWGT